LPLSGDLLLLPRAGLLLDPPVLVEAVEVPRRPLVLPPLIDVELEVADQPEVAGRAREQLRLDALGPDHVRAADVDEDAAVARLLRPAPLQRQDVVGVVLLGN